MLSNFDEIHITKHRYSSSFTLFVNIFLTCCFAYFKNQRLKAVYEIYGEIFIL